MKRTATWVSLAAAIALSPVSHARAAKPSAADAQRGRQLFSEGRMQFDLGHFERAIELFEESYRLKPDPAYLFNIAQAYRLSGNPSRAVFFYRSYLRNRPTAPNRAHVETLIDQCLKEAEEEKRRSEAKTGVKTAQATPEPEPEPVPVQQPSAPTSPQPAPTAPAPVAAEHEEAAEAGSTYYAEVAAGMALWLAGGPADGGAGLVGGVAFGVEPSWGRGGAYALRFSARAGLWSARDGSGRTLFIPLLIEPAIRVALGGSPVALVIGCGFGVNVIPALDEDSDLLKPDATRVVGVLSALEARPSAAVEYALSSAAALKLTGAYAYDGNLDQWFRSRSLQRFEITLGALFHL